MRQSEDIDLSGDDEAIIQAAEYILERWKEIENVHGKGCLTNYRHRLNHSPAKHIGLEEIENAKRFQENSIMDRTWALGYC
ncbi:hypothetical protein [Rhizobium sp. Rhizsp82]|uniref:hypothetical protein n=1 Tax=Rhizobium sp. Rhizsp82 TaxID=3243057 RepID=UPI0039B66535